MTDIAGFVAFLPKAEPYLNVEGTFEPASMFAIARCNGIRLSRGAVDEVWAAHTVPSLHHLLDICCAGAGVQIEAREGCVPTRA